MPYQHMRRFIPPHLAVVWDAARRATEQINENLRRHGPHAYGRWCAVALADGATDRTLYDTKADAVRHQRHEERCAYVSIPPGGVSVRGMAHYLHFTRALYARGYRLRDPDQPLVHMPMSREHAR